VLRSTRNPKEIKSFLQEQKTLNDEVYVVYRESSDSSVKDPL
jgi:hypothetical protein